MVRGQAEAIVRQLQRLECLLDDHHECEWSPLPNLWCEQWLSQTYTVAREMHKNASSGLVRVVALNYEPLCSDTRNGKSPNQARLWQKRGAMAGLAVNRWKDCC